MDINNEWKKTEASIFWGEIAPCDHVVQIYESEDAFTSLLSDFVREGFTGDDCVIVIATASHLDQLNSKLTAEGFNLESLHEKDQYIPLDAEETLTKFMVNDWPDERKFNILLNELFTKARNQKRQVRAFGEMVALLWAKGNNGATIHLEHLWNKFAHTHAFSLFCAYPKSGFTEDPVTSIKNICNQHSKLITGTKNQVEYKNLEFQRVG
jgi:hypothetical protein